MDAVLNEVRQWVDLQGGHIRVLRKVVVAIEKGVDPVDGYHWYFADPLSLLAFANGRSARIDAALAGDSLTVRLATALPATGWLLEQATDTR